MNRSIRSFAASVAVAFCLWPVAAAAQDAPVNSGPTVEQVRGVFSGAGYQVDPAINWDWTAPPVSSFRVHDVAQLRELMVLVYPDATAAEAARRQGSHLVIGYGESVWRGNVAMVQTTQAWLDAARAEQIARENGFYVEPQPGRDPGLPSVAVDLDFLQALDSGAANF